ncbi:MAG: GDP-4-dehydro-6-deoxy-D-mannose reductase [Clostridia bacterium]|nr:GDP-4-dehydro-6-deoxy-D-mannose reductase [Clostridia bacterium]
MKILITGITGFAGSHLAEYALNQQDVEVFGTVRVRSKLDNIEHLLDKINLVECNLLDPFAVRKVIETVRPDRIFHLAAQSFVPTSWGAPEETLQNNILSELNIFEAVRSCNNPVKIQIACSSEEYGMVYPEETPIKEKNPLRPLSPYGVSKVAQDLLGYQYQASYGLHIVRTRAFNHTGPRRGEMFVTSNFCKQVAEIEKGLRKPVIKVGNLEAKRDFTDVRDTVRGYWLALEYGVPGEVYNIASGIAIKIKELLDMILALSNQKITVEVDESRLRPSDVPILLGDYSKFNKQTGWKPEISLKKTITDLLNYWRDRVC